MEVARFWWSENFSMPMKGWCSARMQIAQIARPIIFFKFVYRDNIITNIVYQLIIQALNSSWTIYKIWLLKNSLTNKLRKQFKNTTQNKGVLQKNQLYFSAKKKKTLQDSSASTWWLARCIKYTIILNIRIQ